MVEHQSAQIDAVFRALADPTRRALLAALANGEHSVKALAEPHPMSLAGIAKHVRVLEDAGLVSRRKQGRENIMRLEPTRLFDAHQWIDSYLRFWAGRLDALDRALREGEKP